MNNSNITLRKISESDTSNIVKWRNSEAVRRNLFTQTILTEQQHINYLKTKVEGGSCVQYIIVSPDDNDIGTAFVKKIDVINNKGEFGMFIGEPSGRGKGYAKIVVSEMLNIAFEELHLNRVYLTVMCDNIAAVKSYKYAGFVIEGVMKEDYFREYDNKYIDVILMGITKNMWIQNKNYLSNLKY